MNTYDKIKVLAEALGKNIDTIESECGFPKGYISTWNKIKPDNAEIKRVADYLNISVTAILPDIEKEISPPVPQRASTPNAQANEKKESSGCLIGIIMFIIISAIFIVSLYFVTVGADGCNPKNTDGAFNPTSRSATLNDVNLTPNNDLSLSINCGLVPKVDISNLKLTFTFKNGNGDTITTKVKNVGDVIESKNYTVTISLSEFSFKELISIVSYTVNVTGGTVSYFA